PCRSSEPSNGQDTYSSLSFVSTPIIHQMNTGLDLPGRPQPNPTNKYNKNTTVKPSKTLILTFFHHIRRFNPLLLLLNSPAPTSNRFVLSTNNSILSPLSITLSIFSLMIPRTLSNSPLTSLAISFVFPCRF